jgi:hypothetical protein
MHAHLQANKHICTITNTFHSHAHVHADNNYVHVNKYIHILEHTYRDIQILSFIHEHLKKIFDLNILNRKIFSSKNIFTVKKLFKQTNIHT